VRTRWVLVVLWASVTLLGPCAVASASALGSVSTRHTFASAAEYAVALAPGHSALVSVVPADGSTLTTGPTELVLVFNEDINPSFATLALTRSGSIVPISAPGVAGRTVRATLADPGPGSYRIAFRVVSADSHPISGETTFTVAGTPTASASGSASTGSASTGTSAPVPSAATTASAAVTSNGSQSRDLTLLVVGGVLGLGGLGMALVARRRG
jgi:methionine-rich copper-binding protein CopC